MAAPVKAPTVAPATSPHIEPSSVPSNHYPLFKGATRAATIKGGVPTRAFVALVLLTLFVAMFTLWGWAIGPILYPVVAVLSRNDDRAFWIWELWVKTKFLAKNKRFWGAISLTPTPYSRRRPWARWLGVHDR